MYFVRRFGAVQQFRKCGPVNGLLYSRTGELRCSSAVQLRLADEKKKEYRSLNNYQYFSLRFLILLLLLLKGPAHYSNYLSRYILRSMASASQKFVCTTPNPGPNPLTRIPKTFRNVTSGGMMNSKLTPIIFISQVEMWPCSRTSSDCHILSLCNPAIALHSTLQVPQNDASKPPTPNFCA